MSHVYNENNSTMLSMVMTIAECLNDGFYSDKPTPVFHISTEVMRQYYIGWIIKKKSIWKNVLNAHILTYQQVFSF